jgi:TolB protein
LEDVAALDQQSGRLVMAVDLADRPVFSPSFAASHSALFEESAKLAVAPEGGGQSGFVRVLSIANDRGRNYHPRLSPDGRLIAFDSDRDGVRGVYVASRDGRNVRRVSGSEYAAFAAWSPDGLHLAFVRSEPAQPTVWNVWSLNVQSGATARLTSYSTGQPWGVSWFPDGRRICFAHEHELVVLDTFSGETHSYASPRANRTARMPVVSPDGSRIIFQVDNDGAWLLEMSDGSMREVLADPTAEDFAWSPDGRRIVFRTRPDGWSFWSLEPGA